MTEPLWYVAYGSNMAQSGMSRYIGDDAARSARSTWLDVERELYFAGHSVRWGAAVAFLSLEAKPGFSTPVRAFALTEAQLWEVFRAENGVRDDGELSLASLGLQPGQWRVIDSGRREPDDPAWKYNAVLRLDDIDGAPAYTFTTARDLVRGKPADAYAGVIQKAVESRFTDRAGAR